MFRVLFHREVLAAISLSALIVCSYAYLGYMYAQLGILRLSPMI